MSVSLTCGCCGTVMGNASMEDNYKEHFLKLNKKGEPVCPNCNCGDNHWWTPFAVIGILLGAILIIEEIVYGVGSLINGYWL